MVEGESNAKEYLKFAGVIAGITLVSYFFYSLTDLSGISEWMRVFMGVFFLTFAGFKFAGYKMFPDMFATYDVVAKRFKPYGYAFPFIELALGLLYLTDTIPMARDVLTVIVMAVSSIGVFQEIKKRSGIHCACLGNVIKLPLSTVSLVEDVAMGLMALAMIISR